LRWTASCIRLFPPAGQPVAQQFLQRGKHHSSPAVAVRHVHCLHVAQVSCSKLSVCGWNSQDVSAVCVPWMQYVEKMKVEVLENLRHLGHAPGVQFDEAPPDAMLPDYELPEQLAPLVSIWRCWLRWAHCVAKCVIPAE
jgi:hypothetical protein